MIKQTAEREAADLLYRNHFGAFVYAAFEAVYPGQKLVPNWHIDCVCHQLLMMATGQAAGRLVLNMPPRTLKSFMVSVCLPAWLLGRNAGAKIMCASYSEDLANKFSRDCRALTESPFYKRVFPRTNLNPRKSTEGEFEARILLENYYLPGDLEASVGRFVDHYNHRRYHESLSNLTPADVYFGRGQTILLEQRKDQTTTSKIAACSIKRKPPKLKSDEPIDLAIHHRHPSKFI